MAFAKATDNPPEITAASLWVVLSRAYTSIAAAIEHSLAGQGIGLSDFMVLEVLLHKGPLPMSAIAEKVLLANASMTSAVDRLDGLGLVARQSSTEDRRVRLVVLTPAGRKLITTLYRTHAQSLETLMRDLSPAERKLIRAGLKSIGLAAKATLGSR